MAQDDQAPPQQDQTPVAGATETPSPTVFPERRINWLKLIPNVARDQKDIWLFPISLAEGRHVRPAIAATVITAGLVGMVDVPSGKYFQRTSSFNGFNRVFSGKNTSAMMFLAPGAFYGLSLLRKDSYGQHTFLLAGEAVLDSEILTSVMKDIDQRMKPIEVGPNGDFSKTWFRSDAGSVLRGIGSFPSGHTISAFSVATVFADRYPKPRWRAWTFYGVAALFGFSRISLQSHHPSDVFAGAFLGYTIAHYTVLRAGR
jgi:membrane-associated phospholipid phosphatase